MATAVMMPAVVVIDALAAAVVLATVVGGSNSSSKLMRNDEMVSKRKDTTIRRKNFEGCQIRPQIPAGLPSISHEPHKLCFGEQSRSVCVSIESQCLAGSSERLLQKFFVRQSDNETYFKLPS